MLNLIGDGVVSFIISLLSGMGVGSAGLLVVWLTEVDGTAQLTAQGINLIFFLFSASAAAFRYLRRPTINKRAIRLLIPFAAAGAIIGSLAVGAINPAILRRIFGGSLVLVGGLTLLRSFFPRLGKKADKKNKI